MSSGFQRHDLARESSIIALYLTFTVSNLLLRTIRHIIPRSSFISHSIQWRATISLLQTMMTLITHRQYLTMASNTRRILRYTTYCLTWKRSLCDVASVICYVAILITRHRLVVRLLRTRKSGMGSMYPVSTSSICFCNRHCEGFCFWEC